MKTPFIQINNIYAKLEAFNMTGSIKDRMAEYIIDQAEKRGELSKGQSIIEVTSGNTGIALARIAAARGYRFIAVMPESMSHERRQMMKAFGAELILTPAKEDVAGAIQRYEELIKEYPHAFLPKQFENPDNIEAHQIGLGQEILEEIPQIHAFVAGVGTGGTLIGVANALKLYHPRVKIIAVEPAESAVLSGEKPALHKIQGIGEGFIPPLVEKHLDLIDQVIKISSHEAIHAQKTLAKRHGLLVGISSGANFLAAQQIQRHYRNVVTIFPDRGERYLSM